jgi:regulator of replication initiation timing
MGILFEKDYQYVFKRLYKIEKTIKQLVEENCKLREANAALRTQHQTDLEREVARERVLASIQT